MPVWALGTYGLACFGWLMVAILLMNGALAALSAGLRLRTAMLRRAVAPADRANRAAPSVRPFYSVHVPAHDEPPPMLMATLDALAALDWPDHEVIVIDNNTPDAATWRPVASHCERLGARFRFFHRDGVAGAKAGALNIALSLSDVRATHIVVVDADYRVAPDFLGEAAAALARHRADYVQFPQAYRYGPTAEPVALELGDYFRAHAPAANANASMLLTGTLCVIAREWLDRVGGWPTETITEDADLGLRLFRAGARGVFAGRVAGRGMLPLDFAGLALQRERWVAGNMQTLARGLGSGLGRTRRGLLSVLTQLLAWPAFLAVPVLALLLCTPGRLAGVATDGWRLAEVLAAGTIGVALAAMLLELVVLKREPETLVVKLSLLWTASLAWLPLLWGSRPAFRRTPKAGPMLAGLPATMRWGSAVLLAAALLQILSGAPLPALALLVPLLSLPAARQVDAGLRAAALRPSRPCVRRIADALPGCHPHVQQG